MNKTLTQFGLFCFHTRCKAQAGHRRMHSWMLVLLLHLIVTIPAVSQGTLSGTITDGALNTPLSFANVAVKGTTIGTVTDDQGNFTIAAPAPGAIIQVSYLGYVTQEIEYAGQTKLDVILQPELADIDEVVVIGYGTQKKGNLTGAVGTADMEDIARANATTVDKALAGRVAGVYVANTSGKPGENASIRIRGAGTLTADSDAPLFVVDGVIMDGNPLNTLNPNDIESISVLKDASSQAIYGTRGGPGVILIETKKGRKGKPVVNFNMTLGQSEIIKKYDIMNSDQYSALMKEAYKNYNIQNPSAPLTVYEDYFSDSARLANGITGSTDWQDELTQKAFQSNYSLSISGGSENMNYLVSGNYAAEDGILIGTGFKRYSVKANTDYNIGKRIKIGEIITLSRIENEEDGFNTNGNPWWVATVTSPYMPVYDTTVTSGYAGPDSRYGNNERTNPVAEQMLNDEKDLNHEIFTKGYATIEFLPGLTYSLNLGVNTFFGENRRWTPGYELGGDNPIRDQPTAQLFQSSNTRKEYYLNNLMNYTKNFEDHNISFLLGYERRNIQNASFYLKMQGFQYPDDLQVFDQGSEVTQQGGGVGEHKLVSYFGRLNYDFKNRYIFSASWRRDGSTRFDKNNRWGNFPSFSIGYRLSDDFLKSVEKIDQLKIRFGWGRVGNENFEDYFYFETIDPDKNSRYAFGNPSTVYTGGAPTTRQAAKGIKWEEVESYNWGLDLNMYNNKLTFSGEYYIKNQYDMLVQIPISVVYGKRVNYGTGTPTAGSWGNLGQMQNRGFEFNLGYREFRGAFSYSVNANLTTIKNEVIDVGETPLNTEVTSTQNGHSIGNFYGYIAEGILQKDDFLCDADGEPIQDINGQYTLLGPKQEAKTAPGDIKFKDLNGDNIIDGNDVTFIGKSVPDFIYGLNIDLSYKIVDFSIFFQGMQNYDVYNYHRREIGIATDVYGKDQNKLVETLNYWTPENPSTTMTRASAEDGNRNARISSWFVEDASFLRIKNVQIGVSVPQKFLAPVNISRLRFYFSVSNAFTFTKYSGYDPEVGSNDPKVVGIDRGYYPTPRTWQVGLNLDF